MASSILRLPHRLIRSNHCHGINRSITTTSTPPPPPPWLMLPPVIKGGDMLYNFYSLVDDQVLTFNSTRAAAAADSDESPPPLDAKIVGSSHGWLASFDRRSHRVFLSNPVSGRHIRLPPIGRRYGCCVSRVILTAPPDAAGCRAVAAATRSSYAETLTCLPRVSSEWSPFTCYRHHVFDDLACCSSTGELHEISRCEIGFDSRDTIASSDCSSRGGYVRRLCWSAYSDKKKLHPSNTPGSAPGDSFAGTKLLTDYDVDVEFLKGSCRQEAHLVCSDRLGSSSPMIVVRFVTEPPAEAGVMERLAFPYKSVAFVALEIERAEVVTSSCNRVEGGVGVAEDLKGLAIFVGMNHTFAVPAAEYGGKLKPNSIYFADVSRRRKLTPPDRDWWGPKRLYGGHDIGIFDYETKTISPCYYPCEVEDFTKIDPHPMWFTPSPY